MGPVSPVERVTRARAAAKKDTATTKSKSTRVTKSQNDDDMNAPPKKGMAAKTVTSRRTKTVPEATEVENAKGKGTKAKEPAPAASLAAVPRRRVKVTPLEPIQQQPEPEPPRPLETSNGKKTSTRSKKADKTKEGESNPQDSAPPTRARANRTNTTRSEKKAEEPVVSLKTTRGRPKKTIGPEIETTATAEPTKRQTRSRTGSSASVNQATADAAVKPTTTTRKKVTFQDLPESDKENVPIPSRTSTAKKSKAAPTTGIRAKPLRKPAATNAAIRKKATTTRDATKEDKVQPEEPCVLTPKKITQVTRSTTPNDSDGDELNGAKTPVRDLSLSPKRVANPSGTLSPVKKLNFTPALQPNSPEKSKAQPTMLSPARRLPTSPYKDSLKESPRRGEVMPTFLNSTSKPHTINPALLTASTPSQSRLLQSPKRGALNASLFSNSNLRPQQPPLKTSLLQSPARRLFSPEKAKVGEAERVHVLVEEDALHTRSPDAAVSCNFRASQSPERGCKVITLSDDELTQETTGFLDFDNSVLNIRSPLKINKATPSPGKSPPQENAPDSLMFDNVLQQQLSLSISPEGASNKVTEEVSNVQFQLDPMEGVVTTVASSEQDENLPLSSVLFRAPRGREAEESSEDELQSPEKSFHIGRPNVTSINVRSRLSTAIGETSRDMGFTPLAVQFSSWLASSPEKQGQNSKPRHGLFSPVATEHVPGEVQISRQSTPRQKTPANKLSANAKSQTASRLSIAQSTAGTPSKTSLEDEMKARESDEIIDNQDASEAQSNLNPDSNDKTEVIAELHPAELVHSEGDDAILPANDDLTTDLVNQNTFTDTAVIDFAALAEEAKELATAAELHSRESSNSSTYGDENLAPIEPAMDAQEDLNEASAANALHVELFRDSAAAAGLASPENGSSGNEGVATPIRRDLTQPRFLNTVVSKVPLRPEGEASPLKITKKRPRSMSEGPLSSAKRRSLEDIRNLGIQTATMVTPDRIQQSATLVTPGQISFTVDDFGDSTLDGIELPDDVIMDENEGVTTAGTPSAMKSTPTVRNVRSVSTPSRTPLKAVGNGVLHGAVVYVDVHTSEGADASGIFVELLTQMGAKCVKEWKWKSRASLAAMDAGEEVTPPSNKIGITHVIYKDGGKRTLEKIRDANKMTENGHGGVWCVGVGWVLE